MKLSRTDRTGAAWLLWAAVLATTLRCADARAHLLWRVEGANATVYLLGSLHMLRAEDYPLPEPVEAAFAQADILVFEADFAVLEGIGGRTELLAQAVLPQGELLSEHVPPELYARVRAFLERTGIPGDMLERLKPSMAAVTIEVLELARHGLDPRFGVDKHLYARARSRGKRMEYLESVEFQLDLILDLTPPESEALLRSTLDKVDDSEHTISGLLDAWRRGDAAALETLVIEPMRASPGLYARMITDRNARWVESIARLAQGGDDVLVVVGAAHLVGESSVVDLLRRRGYRVSKQ